MSQLPKFEVDQYIGLALRRKWWIIFSLVVALLGGGVYLKITPKIFRASTLVLLEPQSIPDAFVRSTVTETVEGRLRTIQQQVHSRTNIESIIGEFHLDRQVTEALPQKVLRKIREYLTVLKKEEDSAQQKEVGERIRMMTLVEEIRKGMQVTMRGGRDQHLAFEIAFEWYDPDIVAPVTNAVASRFIEENLSLREEKAIGTTDFLEKETMALRGELESREKELEDFKKQNMGTLPDQLQSNLSILNQLRDELLNQGSRLEEEKQQAMLIKSQAQLSQERAAMVRSSRAPEEGSANRQRESGGLTNRELTSGSLPELEAELKRLSSQYTEQHPDVVTLKRRIDALRAEGPRDRPDSPAPSSGSMPRELAIQLGQINARIESYHAQIKDGEKQIESYKERVERTPQVEMELNKILRGYEIVRQRYDNLLSRKLDAKMSEQLEKRRKGEQFRVLDSAVKPAKPFRPDATKAMLMACLGGLALGFGLGYLREMMDPCFYDPKDLEAFLEAPIIMSLPEVDLPVRVSKKGKDGKKQQLNA